MKELVQYLAKSLVNDPNAVEVNETDARRHRRIRAQSRQGRPWPSDRPARPHGEIDPHAAQRCRFQKQPQSHPGNRRRKVTCSQAAPMAEPSVPLGEIVTTHGLDGWLKLNPFNSDTAVLVAGRKVYLDRGDARAKLELAADARPIQEAILDQTARHRSHRTSPALVGRDVIRGRERARTARSWTILSLPSDRLRGLSTKTARASVSSHPCYRPPGTTSWSSRKPKKNF